MDITSCTKLFGIIGDPVEHSMSPVMHNAAFEALEMDCVYLAFRVERRSLYGAVNGIRSFKLKGVNVTIPHKIEVMKYLDSLDETAKSVGAVNTILNLDGELTGYNTDGTGALMALREVTSLKGARVLILGTGGAARAVAFSVANEAEEAMVMGRDESRARKLASSMGSGSPAKFAGLRLTPKNLEAEMAKSDIVVNATPVGMHPKEDESLIEEGWFQPEHVIFDVVYNPLETRLLREARNAGAKTVSGLKMLVYQGAAAFRIWFNREPPVKVMLNAAYTRLMET